MHPVLGLALGGGALLGLAHIGVLEVLEGAGIVPDLITGTSIGALVAACYAGGAPVAAMKRTARTFSWRDVRKRKMIPTSAVYSNLPMRNFLEKVLPCRDFDGLNIPLGVVATDLRTAQMVILGGEYLREIDFGDDDITILEADMIEAVRASCTVPVLFEPVQLGGRILVDGFLTNNVPAGLARKMGADIVIAVDLQQRRAMYENPSNIFEYTMQSQIIYRYWAVKNRHIWADVVVHPDLAEYEWDDTAKISSIIVAGREATLEKLPEIERAVAEARDAAAEPREGVPASPVRSEAS
ncbi:MAG: patatin-like phospholipase family protein [Planctomycetes bacterium]|nr:patatin-like phospholipase family protein [Planctomycetota bacterium]